MKKTASIGVIIIFVFSLIFSAGLNLGQAQSGQSVSGIIFSDTAWTKANSPINITGPTAIAKGVTVTVEPGVVVHFNINNLQVNGTFRAVGTSTDPITLNGDYRGRQPVFGSSDYNGILGFSSESTSWDEQTGTGCIIENAHIISLSISIGTSVKINNNVISGSHAWGALYAGAGNSVISNNKLYDGAGISVGNGSTIIVNNTLVGANGIGVSGNGSPSIVGNVLYKGFAGITVSGGSDVRVADNVIANGIGFKATGGNLTFEHNLVLNCSEGCALYSFEATAVVQHNTIAYSQYGIESPPASAKVIYNNLENNQVNFVCRYSLNFDAAYNWWGTTDPVTIAQTISDYKKDYNAGNVTFIPYLQTEDTEAPSITSFVAPEPEASPSPTPTHTLQPTAITSESPMPTATANPTFATSTNWTVTELLGVIVFLSVIIVGLIVALVVMFKRRKIVSS